ncbi:MAG: hypothetical protein H3Z50_01220 [archaeon]|nr:hypothetical protein [archaeon]MCP8306266.1 hypothetical protein [archaeon]
MDEVVKVLFLSEKCPNEILKYLDIDRRFTVNRSALMGDLKLLNTVWNFVIDHMKAENGGKMLDSRIFPNIPDVVFIASMSGESNELFINITTIKEQGMSIFTNFIKCIPYIGESVNQLRHRQTFSSRYTFRPYPLAVRLWLEHSEKATAVPKDLRDFLKGAVKYHSSKEWRTSIVLSAITVESILADLYEEQFKEYAPDVPLGELYYKVKEKIDFPSDISGAIETVNKSRISAVHRSRFPVSDREAVNALYGATTLTMWYSSNF